jgi:hypothetical protein
MIDDDEGRGRGDEGRAQPMHAIANATSWCKRCMHACMLPRLRKGRAENYVATVLCYC